MEAPTDYTSSYAPDFDPVTASATRNVLREAPHVAALYVIGPDGSRLPVRAVMVDRESDDAPNVYIYTDQP
jgi:hypothetical protein